MFNSTKMMLANSMMIGVIMTICSNNWISMWMGLEISLLSFIPFMQSNNQMSSESMIKYFIIQSIASMMFLFSVVVMLVGDNMNNEIMMMIAMLIKIGSAPFHNWILLMIETNSLLTLFNLLTTLKIPPLIILYQINMKMLNIPIMLSLIISSISCLNQTSIRKTIAYSSIFNTSMLMSTISKLKTSITFLVLYSITLILMIMNISKLKMNFINQMNMNEFNIWVKMSLFINMLSMGGFPPMLGFLGKMLIIQTMISLKMNMMLTIMIISSILIMLIYLRMMFLSLLTMSTTKKWTLLNNKTLYSTIWINIMLTPILMTMNEMD